jgi:ketosteroid isomerase-like protein
MRILPLVVRLSVLLVLLAPFAGSSARAQRHEPGAAMSADAPAVTATIRALFAAAERSDLAALDTLYAGDSLLVIEGTGINRGWRDYRDNHLGPELRAFRNFKYRPFEIEVRVAGNVAWATYRYAISAETGERQIDAVGRGTAILERRGEKWVVRLTQTSSRNRRPTDPPMP